MKFSTNRKATIYCLSRTDSQELCHQTLVPEISNVLKNFFTNISFEKSLSRPSEQGKDFIFIFGEGVSGTADEGDLKLLMDAIHHECSKTFGKCSVSIDKNSTCEGSVLIVMKIKGVDQVEIFSSFPDYQFTLA